MSENSSTIDMGLLRRFEPVIRYTCGERFFPIQVDRYVQQCSLWIQRPKEAARCIIPQGELTLEKLSEPRQGSFGAVYFIKFIEPLDILNLARYSLNEVVKNITGNDPKNVFRAGIGRLARVGYLSRLLDAVFSVTLLMRGRVPGDTAAAAALTYQQIQSQGECNCYYGRVVRQASWLVLQYWFFYPFNNWRSGFFGVNDHEGDWEMISIYCCEEEKGTLPEDRITPCWVAYASHDFSGDDLRRRWDDPELEKLGEHPLIFAGAGSHASYYFAGEYLAELELAFLAPLDKITDKITAFWDGIFHQAHPTQRSEMNVFSVPFVDYARGDGVAIGPGQEKIWQPCFLNPEPSWVSNYRGLWGLYARDPISGENAPAGPKYNRDGSVRSSWYDPVGWAGLDKVPPPNQAVAIIDRQRAVLTDKKEEINRLIDQKDMQLKGAGIEDAAMHGFSHLENVHSQQSNQIRGLSQELNDLRREITLLDAKLEAMDSYEARLKHGDWGPARAHIRRAHRPSSEIELRMGRLAEIFSAMSIGVLMITIVFLAVFWRHYLLFGLVVTIGALVFIESGFRRQLTRLVSSLAISLAIVNAATLLFEFFWYIVVGAVLAAGLFIIWENLREIRRSF